MLKIRDKKRIKNEEFYRNSIRQKNQKRKNLIDFLNQPFIIWVLSTVLVGLFSFSYAKWNDIEKQRRIYYQTQISLIQELEFRIYYINNLNLKVTSIIELCEEKISSDDYIIGSEYKKCLDTADDTRKTMSIISARGTPNELEVLDWFPSKTYRRIEFKNESITDLVNSLLLQSPHDDREEILDDIENIYSDISDILDEFPVEVMIDWNQREIATGQYKVKYGKLNPVFSAKLDDVLEMLEIITDWLDDLDFEISNLSDKIEESIDLNLSKLNIE